ncbi:hypothetical protein E2320_007874 [Naja naja]|nr:hypothetical protein E2320_007874 [Naja naja]
MKQEFRKAEELLLLLLVKEDLLIFTTNCFCTDLEVKHEFWRLHERCHVTIRRFYGGLNIIHLFLASQLNSWIVFYKGHLWDDLLDLMAVLEWAEERTDYPIKPETLIWLLLLDSVRVDRRHSPPCQSTPPRSSFSFPLLSSTFPLRGCLLLKGAPWLHSEVQAQHEFFPP